VTSSRARQVERMIDSMVADLRNSDFTRPRAREGTENPAGSGNTGPGAF
jgi:hypothetical protein